MSRAREIAELFEEAQELASERERMGLWDGASTFVRRPRARAKVIGRPAPPSSTREKILATEWGPCELSPFELRALGWRR